MPARRGQVGAVPRRARPLPERKRERKRQEILTVAASLFARQGYRATTMEQLADHFGFTKPALYYYIGSKEKLLVALLNDAFDKLEAAIDEARHVSDDAGERLRRLMQLHVELATADTKVLFGLVVVDSRDSTVGRELMDSTWAASRKYLHDVAELAADAQASGVLPAGVDRTVAALGIIGMCTWVAWWYRPMGRLRPAEIAEDFARLLLRDSRRS